MAFLLARRTSSSPASRASPTGLSEPLTSSPRRPWARGPLLGPSQRPLDMGPHPNLHHRLLIRRRRWRHWRPQPWQLGGCGGGRGGRGGRDRELSAGSRSGSRQLTPRPAQAASASLEDSDSDDSEPPTAAANAARPGAAIPVVLHRRPGPGRGRDSPSCPSRPLPQVPPQGYSASGDPHPWGACPLHSKGNMNVPRASIYRD